MTTRKTMTCALVAFVAAAALTGCAEASNATPSQTTFPFSGRTLDVRAHETPTDLVAADRKDIKVTLWFDVKGTNPTSSWSLDGKTLELRAGCSGWADCSARFRVEVPHGVKVLRDGRKTDLRGTPSTGTAGTGAASSTGAE
ncbi:hypothetical protein [Streptosporangium pseudovulgare]|uniref:Lipoprotein n=1 Tax=Streptosporangium pseudovulgare TaxID=35765 RepID=A0ABQ2R3D3_9ACTN|nr:hypothetical protein [Streptosporangium pseudovulgare]GGQ05815.1 hypothetical protein GCM10010140_40210 [Streptosporangium pseudovulgare]